MATYIYNISRFQVNVSSGQERRVNMRGTLCYKG